jgi:hypothetical protein
MTYYSTMYRGRDMMIWASKKLLLKMQQALMGLNGAVPLFLSQCIPSCRESARVTRRDISVHICWALSVLV